MIQVSLSTAEVLAVPLVSAAFFSGIDKARLFLNEYDCVEEMMGKKTASITARTPLMCRAPGKRRQ